MAMVSFHKIATASSLPTPTAKTEGRIYFVEDTQSFYKGSSKTVNDTTTYEFTPVKVLINGATATLSDADVEKVRNDDNTLSAASQAKLDKPMDTEALYKTFLTRNEKFKFYFVPDADIITETVYDGTSYYNADTGEYGNTIDIPDVAATLDSLDDAYKDGRTIVLIKKSSEKYCVSYLYNSETDIDKVAWPDALYRTSMSYGGSQLVTAGNPSIGYDSNIYDEFVYSITNQQWEKIGDWTEGFRLRWYTPPSGGGGGSWEATS